MNYHLATIHTDDVDKLRLISRETFKDTFGADNSTDDLEQYLVDAYNNEKLLNEIQNPGTNFQFIIYNHQIAGYLKLNVNDAQSESEGPQALEIERIYILKNFKRHGLGTALIQYAINEAQRLNKTFIWLGVWEHNEPALKFYAKMGFKAFSDHIFPVGDDPQRDILMKKEL
jgi:diamine N-acetyltransferase